MRDERLGFDRAELARSPAPGISGMPAPAAGAAPAAGGWRRRAAQKAEHVLLGDAALLAGALQLREIDAELARGPAHAGARMHAG